MTFYVDTSGVVAALTRERKSEVVIDWMTGQPSDTLFISEWVMTEVSAALSIKVRRGEIDVREMAASLAQFRLLQTSVLRILEFKRAFFAAASSLAEQHRTGLRAADALHLAICKQYAMHLLTLDQSQGAAALHLGIETVLL